MMRRIGILVCYHARIGRPQHGFTSYYDAMGTMKKLTKCLSALLIDLLGANVSWHGVNR